MRPPSVAPGRVLTRGLFLAAVCAALLCGCRSTVGPLPPSVDLTRKASFPVPVRQQGNACAQHVGLYYLLAAETGRTTGRAPRLSPYAAYSMLADTWKSGTHVADGWLLAREMGVPLLADWPGPGRGWMNGFDRYVRAHRHKPKDWQFLPMRTADDLAAVKRLLVQGRPVACDFQVRDARLVPLPPGSRGGGDMLAVHWGSRGQGHVMVYAGYDDEIGFDFNGDGRITTDIDITGDGRVTLADCERGAFLTLNPWGTQWGRTGRVWTPYREHALRPWPLAGEVAVVTPAKASLPKLMLRLRLRVPDRRPLVITAGTADRPDATAPDRTWTPLPFRRSRIPYPDGSPSAWEVFARLHRDGPHLSAGSLTAPDGGPVEIGLDVSPLARGGADRWFLDVTAAGAPVSGEVLSAEFVWLDSTGRIRKSVALTGLPATLSPTGGRWMSAAR